MSRKVTVNIVNHIGSFTAILGKNKGQYQIDLHLSDLNNWMARNDLKTSKNTTANLTVYIDKPGLFGMGQVNLNIGDLEAVLIDNGVSLEIDEFKIKITNFLTIRKRTTRPSSKYLFSETKTKNCIIIIYTSTLG